MKQNRRVVTTALIFSAIIVLLVVLFAPDPTLTTSSVQVLYADGTSMWFEGVYHTRITNAPQIVLYFLDGSTIAIPTDAQVHVIPEGEDDIAE